MQGADLEQDLLQAGQGPAKVHVVAHALGLPAEHGRVRAEAGLEFGLRQQVHPDDLPLQKPLDPPSSAVNNTNLQGMALSAQAGASRL